jgi:murein DD-endopeptidase MepM/ murein hydrolase activator NlpD
MPRLPFSEKTITGVYGSMSDFRRKNKMQAHSGTDFAPAGSNRGKTAIPAVVTGKIKLIQWSSVLGWVIVQSFRDTKKNKIAYIGYCHIACGEHGINCKGPKVLGAHMPIKKKVGDVVAEGETIAILGNTGSASSGAHLHLTISWLLKGVFGATADKFDFVKWVKTQDAPATTGKPKTAAAKPKAPAAKKTCPTCGQETK